MKIDFGVWKNFRRGSHEEQDLRSQEYTENAKKDACCQAKGNGGVDGMLLCKTMLEMRLALFTGDWKTILRLEEEQRMVLKREGQSMYLNSLDLCMAFLCAVTGCPEEVPGWIARGEMESALVLFPAVPIMYAIYGQVLLAQKKHGTGTIQTGCCI